MEHIIYIFYVVIPLLQSEVFTQNCDPNVGNTICEGDSCTLYCEATGLINIISANYGRTDRNFCGRNNIRNCRSSMAKHIIMLKCENKTSCVVTASNRVFGDPCSYVKKYVSLVYQCLAKPEMSSPTLMMTETTTMKSFTSESTAKPEMSSSTLMMTETTTMKSSTSESTEETQIITSTTMTTVPQLTTSTSLTKGPQILTSTSNSTGIIVAVVTSSVIIFICLVVILYRRLKLKDKNTEILLNTISNNNGQATQMTTTTSNAYHTYETGSVYHQYIEISTTKAGICTEYSSCIPEYSYSSIVPGNNLDYQEGDKHVGSSSNRSIFKCKDNENDGSYFVLDPKETGNDRLTKSNQEESTKEFSSADDYELAQSTDKKESMDIYTVGNVHYADLYENTHVQHTNTSRQEELYDRVTDGLYDVSSHGRSVTSDSTYDHFNGIKK